MATVGLSSHTALECTRTQPARLLVAPLPAPAAFGSSTVSQCSMPSELGWTSPACCWVDGAMPLWLVNLPCKFCWTGPASWVRRAGFLPRDPVQCLSPTGTCFLLWVSPLSSQGLTRLLPISGTASQNALYSDSFSHAPASSPPETPWARESCPNCPCVLVPHWKCDCCPRSIAWEQSPPVTLWLGPTFAYFFPSWNSQFRPVSIKFLFLLHSCFHRCYPPEHSIPARIPTMVSSPLPVLASQAIAYTSAF